MAATACAYCGEGPIITDPDTHATVCTACGRVLSTDVFAFDVGPSNPNPSNPNQCSSSFVSQNFTYHQRKLHHAKTLILDLTSRLGLSSRFDETLALVSDLTSDSFGAGDWFHVLSAAAAYVVARRHLIPLSLHEAASAVGCDHRQIARMVTRVLAFVDSGQLPSFDAVGALDRAIRTCSKFRELEPEKADELGAMGRFLIQCMMKWFLMTGRRPLPAVAAVAALVAEVNGVGIEVDEIAKEVYAGVNTSRLRLRELKETLARVARALLPWGKDVNFKNVVHHIPVLVRVMESKARFARKKALEEGLGLEEIEPFNLDEYLTLCSNVDDDDEGFEYFRIGSEERVSSDELNSVKISGERLLTAYKNAVDQIANVRINNEQGTKKRMRRELENEDLLGSWEGRWDLGKKLLHEQVLEKDVGFEALPPSFVSGVESREKRKVKIEAAKQRIHQTMNLSTLADQEEHETVLKSRKSRKGRKREVGIKEVDWEDCIIELLLLHRVDGEEIEQGHYSRLLDLHVFNSSITES